MTLPTLTIFFCFLFLIGISIERMMRFLVSHGIFSQDADGRWTNNDESAALSENHPHSAKV